MIVVNGFPGFGVGASRALSAAGLSSLTAGEMNAALVGARAASLIARGGGAFGAALLAAYLLRLAIQSYKAGGQPVPAGWVLCGSDAGTRWSASVGCGGPFGTTVWTKAPSGQIPGPTLVGLYGDVQPANIPGYLKGRQYGTAYQDTGTIVWPWPVVASRPIVGIGAFPLYGNVGARAGAFSGGRSLAHRAPWPAELGTGVVRGPLARPGATVIPGFPGVYPESVDRPVDVPLPIPGVGTGVVPVVPVVPGVGTVVELGPSGVSTAPLVRAAFPTRPNFPIKEMKVRVSMALAGFKMFYNSATEASDFVDALHKALPKCRQAKTQKQLDQNRAAKKYGWNKKYHRSDASPAAKLKAVTQFLADVYADPSMATSQACEGYGRYRDAMRWSAKAGNGLASNALESFVDQALKNLIVENFKDFVYGNIGRKIGDVSRDTGLPVGLQSIKSAAQFNL